jgi:hypothetical protein
MVVDYVIDTKEPNFVSRVILLDHVPDEYFLYVDYLVQEKFLEEENSNLSEGLMRDIVCQVLMISWGLDS